MKMKVSEYKKSLEKVVTLPSGLQVKIKKASIQTIAELTQKLGGKGINVARAKPEEVTEHLSDIIKVLVPKCTVEPNIVNEATEDQLSIHDLTWEDGVELVTQIFEHSGLTEERAQERSRFRKK